MIKNMAKALLNGETEKSTWESGRTENNMAEVKYLSFYQLGYIILPGGEKKEGEWENGKRTRWINEEN